MYIKDLTKEQAIKLARIGTIESWIDETKGFEASYYPYNPDHYSDAYEAYIVYYYCAINGKSEKHCFMLYNTLNASNSRLTGRGHEGLPMRHQWKLFKTMQEMGLEPNDLCYGGCYTQIPYKESNKEKCKDYPNCKSYKDAKQNL